MLRLLVYSCVIILFLRYAALAQIHTKCVSHSRGSHGPQSKEGWGELVAYESACAGVRLSVLLVVL